MSILAVVVIEESRQKESIQENQRKSPRMPIFLLQNGNKDNVCDRLPNMHSTQTCIILSLLKWF